MEALDKFLAYRKNGINKVIKLDVPDDVCLARLMKRGETSGRTDDASEDVNRKRLQVYHEETAPCAAYYEAQGKLAVVHGVGSIDDIFQALSKCIETEMAQSSVSAQ